MPLRFDATGYTSSVGTPYQSTNSTCFWAVICTYKEVAYKASYYGDIFDETKEPRGIC